MTISNLESSNRIFAIESSIYVDIRSFFELTVKIGRSKNGDAARFVHRASQFCILLTLLTTESVK